MVVSETRFRATITGVGDIPGHGPAVSLRPSGRKSTFVPVTPAEMRRLAQMLGEEVTVTVTMAEVYG